MMMAEIQMKIQKLHRRRSQKLLLPFIVVTPLEMVVFRE
jgi:hypothetical protein